MKNQDYHIPFTEIESIPQLIKDFIHHDLEGFSESTFSRENIERAITAKSQFSSENRYNLVETLKKQYKAYSLTAPQADNLARLKESNAFTVVTGHQLNLFMGPVFFIYKILQTIKTAKWIETQFPQCKVVPLFWMASEDHDFEEINHFRTQEHYYEFHAGSGDAVGRISVEDQFFIHEFEKEFRETIYGTELIRWMKEAYNKGNTLSQATRILVQYLFGEMGLLCIDGDEAELKASMKAIFKEELTKQVLYNYSQEKVDYLTKKYGRVQVNPREINLFYLSDTRNRIEYQNGFYHIVDKKWKMTEEEILNDLENNPQNFSPNALLRPVYQQVVLPNLAYIGGNAEIMYWTEPKDYFEHLELPFPVLIPRNSMVFITEKTRKKIEREGLEINDFFGNFAYTIEKKLTENHPLKDLINEKETLLRSSFKELKDKASLTDPTFYNLVDAEEKRQLKSYQKMQKRLLRAEKIKQKEKIERIENLFLTLHPGKIWQERVFNFSVFYADYGRDWLNDCYNEMDVENSTLITMFI